MRIPHHLGVARPGGPRLEGKMTPEELIKALAWKCQEAVNKDAVRRVVAGFGPEPFISLHIEEVLRAALLPILAVAGKHSAPYNDWDAAWLAAAKELTDEK